MYWILPSFTTTWPPSLRAKAGGDFVPVFFDGEFHARSPPSSSSPSARKITSRFRRAPERFSCDEHGEICGEHAFVVNRAAAVEVAVLHDAAERIDGPLRFVHADDVEVGHQQQGAARVRHGARREPRHQETAAGRALENFGVDAFLVEDARQIFRGHEFVSGRIRGVDSDQILQPAEGFAFDLRDVRAREGAACDAEDWLDDWPRLCEARSGGMRRILRVRRAPRTSA